MTLPYPPSANRYWRHPTRGKLAGRHLLSASGRKYRALVAAAQDVLGHGIRLVHPFTGPVRLTIVAHAPDARRRDLDNLLKATLDALTHAGLWEDDSQVRAIKLEWGEIVRPSGQLTVTISDYAEVRAA